jgi:hypothetical protein
VLVDGRLEWVGVESMSVLQREIVRSDQKETREVSVYIPRIHTQHEDTLKITVIFTLFLLAAQLTVKNRKTTKAVFQYSTDLRCKCS